MVPRSYLLVALVAILIVVGLMAVTLGFAIIPVVLIARPAALLFMLVAAWRIIFVLKYEMWIAIVTTLFLIYCLVVSVVGEFTIGRWLSTDPVWISDVLIVCFAAAVWRTSQLAKRTALLLPDHKGLEA